MPQSFDPFLVKLARHLREVIETAQDDGEDDEAIAAELSADIQATAAQMVGRDIYLRFAEYVRNRFLRDGADSVIAELARLEGRNH